MRTITTHLVEGDNPDRQLQVSALDDLGAGGANHSYAVLSPGGQGHHQIRFQNGPIGEFGVNGITQEALLAIVLDRLECFQSGPFACEDNSIALSHCKCALEALQRRTRERIRRGVEGLNQK